MAILGTAMRRIQRFLLVLALTGSFATQAGAQASCGSMAQCAAPPPFETGLRQELSTAGINALLGGLTAALTRVVEGEPLGRETGDAFLRGALGGGVTYAGKRIAVEGFYGAGLVGRELASVGGSIVRNASAGRGTLEELVLPVGPVRLYVSRAGGVVPRLDVGTVIATAAFAFTYDARVDLAESVSAGALVLTGRAPMPGLTSAGALITWDAADMPANERPRLLAHERVHILQYDQAFLSWGEPAERWLVRRTAPGVGFLDHLDFGALSLGLRGGLAYSVDYQDRPWEKEAYFLAQTAHPLTAGAAAHTH